MKRVLAALLVLASTAYSKQPNVLFILCDDLRPQGLGCYGSEHDAAG